MLSLGAISKISADHKFNEPIVLQLTSLEKNANGKAYKASWTDGQLSQAGMLGSQLNELIEEGKLKLGSIARLTSYVINQRDDKSPVVVTTDLEVLSQDDSFSSANAGTPAPGSKVSPRVPLHSSLIQNTPGPAPSPSEDPRSAKQAKTHAGLTPGGGPTPGPSPSGGVFSFNPAGTPPPAGAGGGSTTPVTALAVASERKTVHLMEQLHPYDDQWSIKVMVSRKSPLWSGKAGGNSKFVVELVDKQGRQIQGTFWRAQADKYYDIIQENKVYVFSKFQVKVANKAYNACKNDYEIQFVDKTEILEAPDQDTSAMTVAAEIVPIEHLIKHIGRKAPVDVMGIIVGLGAPGSIKRKSDNSDVQRRDVTLVDQGGKSVVVTLWGDFASEGPAAASLDDHAERRITLQITNCRVTEYNGCSLSTNSKSVLTLNPTGTKAEELTTWWASEGHEGGSAGLTFPSVGGQDGAVSGAKGGSGALIRSFGLLSEVAAAARASTLPSLDAKPSVVEVIGCASLIKTDQTLYYLAHPETGKKVALQNDGSYLCEQDGSTCAAPQHRYVFSFKLVDFSGEVWANVFSQEGEVLLGCSAGKLAEVKEADADAAAATIKAAQWQEWSAVVSSKSREFNGERRMRHTLTSLKPVDYTKECRRLIDAINKY